MSKIDNFKNWMEKQGQPPRLGLVWKPTTHRLIKPEKHESILSVAPKGSKSFAEAVQELSNSNDRRASIKSFEFLNEYAKLALEGKKYPDDKVDSLFRVAQKLSKVLSQQGFKPGYLFEDLSLDTRVGKVVFIDKLIHFTHDAGGFLAQAFGADSAVSEIDEATKEILDEIAGEEKSIDKSLVEIRKQNRPLFKTINTTIEADVGDVLSLQKSDDGLSWEVVDVQKSSQMHEDERDRPLPRQHDELTKEDEESPNSDENEPAPS